MKQVAVGSRQFSKVICGTNPFFARSHFSAARDAEYRGRFDDDRIEQMIARCLDLGINTIESSANERIWRILSRLRNGARKPIHFVGSTRIDATSEMKTHRQKLSFLLENSADVCIVHAQYVDRRRRNGTIPGLDKLLAEIHEAGLLAGISTHRVDTVELCEKTSLDIDVYMFPLNLSGFVYEEYRGAETPQQRADLIRSVRKPFIIIKALGAGRIPPAEGLHFVAENIKPTDLLSIGFGTEEEIDETLQVIDKLF